MRRSIGLFVAALAAGLLATAPAPAHAAPIWNLDIHHNPTNFAPGNPGSATVATDTEGSFTANEVQAISVSATSGQFRLGFAGDTTPDLPFDATGVAVRDALRALSSIGSPNVTVALEARGSARTYRVTFTSSLANTDVDQIVASQGTIPLQLRVERYWFDARNVGDTAAVGPIALVIHLPTGLSSAGAGGSFSEDGVTWSCTSSSAGTTVECTTPGPIFRHTLNDALSLQVVVDPFASGVLTTTAEISGGGATNAANAEEATQIDLAPAAFGILAPSFTPDFFEADGLTPERRSGAHPDFLTIPFDFTSIVDPASGVLIPAGNIRDLTVDLPPGFLGNPTAVADCAPPQLIGDACPAASQVGRVDLVAYVTEYPGPYRAHLPIFNMRSPRGVLADLAFQVSGHPVHIRFSLDPANGYALAATAANLNGAFPPFNMKLTLWGVPADARHDSERCGLPDTSEECSVGVGAEPKPFLTLPSGCGIEQAITLRDYDSWQDGGVFGPEIAHRPPGQTTDCDRQRFEPDIEVNPTGKRANAPTGVEVHLRVPWNDNPDSLAAPPLRSAEVTLPAGMRISPSAADGLTACSVGQIGLGTDDPVACPDSSRIGEASLASPLLPDSLNGFIYLAEPKENPFGSLFAIYLVARDAEDRGVLIKLAGRLDLDPRSGRVTVSFDRLPQLPFEDLTLEFRGGPRAPLVSAPSCGPQTTVAKLASYAQPQIAVDLTYAYRVSEGPGGGPCRSEAERPFAPQLSSGALDPSAGAPSPFVFALARTDSEPELSQVSATLPPGLSASIAGIPFCPDASISSIPKMEGTGQQELTHPSCPPASQVGTAAIATGPDPGPLYLAGSIYLAGPYDGAPFSLVAVVPALAGPFDLGTVVSRMAVRVDPATAQLRVLGDPLPTILSGVPLDLRLLHLDFGRPGFTLNPTSCEAISVDGTAASPSGAAVPISDLFPIGHCANLAFRPRLALRFSGASGRNGHPMVTALLRPRRGDANVRRAALLLPRGELLDPGHLDQVCTRKRFAAGDCPAGSILGWVRAWSPLLDRPLRGRLYLRESARRLPDLAADLHGQVHLVLSGHLDAPHARVRVGFDRLPDIPLSRLELVLGGGRRGLLVNSEGLCAGRSRAGARLVGHNGKLAHSRLPVKAACGGKR